MEISDGCGRLATMKPVSCPRCEALTILVAQKPFCAHCSWNLEAARSAVRGEAVGVWVCTATVALRDLFFTVRKFGDWGMTASAAFMMCIALGYYFFFVVPAQRSLKAARKQLGSQADDEERSGPPSSGSNKPTGGPPDWFFHISKPRTVRVCWHKARERFMNRAFAVGAGFVIFSVFFLAAN